MSVINIDELNKIEWDKESAKVTESFKLICEAHKLHKTMSETEKDRLDYLMDLLIVQENNDEAQKAEV